MSEVSGRTFRMCALYERGVEVGEIAAEFGVQRPAVWKALRRGGLLPPYKSKASAGRGRPRKPKVALAETSPIVIVDRDPCLMCGTRGDVGCRHRPASPAKLAAFRRHAPFHRPFDRAVQGQNL